MKKSVLLSLALLLVVAAWIGSGLLRSGESVPTASDASPATTIIDALPAQPPAVQVRTLAASSVPQMLDLMGVTAPKRAVQVPAQTAGAVISLDAAKGEIARAGALLARIDGADRNARLRQARAVLKQRQAEYQAASKLSKKNLQSQTALTEVQALLDAARASLKAIELDISHTRVVAPFAGVVEQRFVEMGDYVEVGQRVAYLLDLSEVKIRGQVSERDIGRVRVGMPADLSFVDGQRLSGKVTFVARSSDSTTRTFQIEVTALNPKFSIASGMTARISLNLGDRQAHRLSPAVLTLDDEGRVGVKIIDDSSQVRFLPVELISDTPEGMWLGGLPKRIELITVGHEFVSTGQLVTVSRSVQ